MGDQLMVMRSNPYYNSHILAQVGNNLASAIYGDPDYKFKQEANDRANLQTQMAVSQHQQANEAAARRTAANEALASVFDDPQGDIRAAIGPYLRQGGTLGEALLLMGNLDPRHLQALDRLGTEHGNRVELQNDQQDHEINLRNLLYGQDLAKMGYGHTLDIDTLNRENAYTTERDNRSYAFDLGKMGVGHGFDMELEGIRNLGDLLVAAQRGGRGGTPLDVSPTDANYSRQLIDRSIRDLVGGDYEMSPEDMMALTTAVDTEYQNTRNYPASLSSVLDQKLNIDQMADPGEWWMPFDSVTGKASLKQPDGAPVAAPGANPAAEQQEQFVPGKTYTDGQGNRAKYLGNGQWQEI